MILRCERPPPPLLLLSLLFHTKLTALRTANASVALPFANLCPVVWSILYLGRLTTPRSRSLHKNTSASLDWRSSSSQNRTVFLDVTLSFLYRCRIVVGALTLFTAPRNFIASRHRRFKSSITAVAVKDKLKVDSWYFVTSPQPEKPFALAPLTDLTTP